MAKINFELPDGVTFNSVEEKESNKEDGTILRKLSCPNCIFSIKSIVFDNYGRFSGKIFMNQDREIWQGKLASNADKSKKQLDEIFNKKVKDHLDKCKA